MTHIQLKPIHSLNMFREHFRPSQMLSLVDSVLNDNLKKMENNAVFSPRVDVLEDENRIVLQFIVPGIAKEDFRIELQSDVLTISGERKHNAESSHLKFKSIESFYGKFSRSFTLSDEIDQKNIEANLENGILSIHLSKIITKDTNKTTITIK
jgi:HSP20 family protein